MTATYFMTKDELEKLLGGKDIEHTLDIKTLVIDLLKDIPQEELEAIFWQRLPTLDEDFIRDYLYMSRG